MPWFVHSWLTEQATAGGIPTMQYAIIYSSETTRASPIQFANPTLSPPPKSHYHVTLAQRSHDLCYCLAREHEWDKISTGRSRRNGYCDPVPVFFPSILPGNTQTHTLFLY